MMKSVFQESYHFGSIVVAPDCLKLPYGCAPDGPPSPHHLEANKSKLLKTCRSHLHPISHEILGRGSQGNTIRPIRDYWWLPGLSTAHWGRLGSPCLGSNGLYDYRWPVCSWVVGSLL